MSRGYSEHPQIHRNRGLNRVGDSSQIESSIERSGQNTKPLEQSNSPGFSIEYPTDYIHIMVKNHFVKGEQQPDKKSSISHSKKVHHQPQNALVFKQIGQKSKNFLQIPQSKGGRIKSEPHSEAPFLHKKIQNYYQEGYRYVQSSIPSKNEQSVDQPEVKISKASRNEKNKQRQSGRMKSGKGNGSGVVVVELTGSIEDRRLQGDYKSKVRQHYGVHAHNSSNILLNERGENALSFTERCRILKATVPSNQTMEFDLQREKKCCPSFSNPQYSLVIKNKGFLVNAKKEVGHINSYYTISVSQEEYNNAGSSYMGYLQGNFTGSQFNLYSFEKQVHQVVATIFYEPSISCCSSDYRIIQVYLKIPSLQSQDSNSSLSLKQIYNTPNHPSKRSVVKLISKVPKWNEKRKCFIMNFKGKSKMGSIKNMVLIEQSKPDDYMVMFCKTDPNTFYLEVAHPVTPFIAMGIVLSGFDFKLCCQ